MPIFLKSWSLNLLKNSGPVQASNRTAFYLDTTVCCDVMPAGLWYEPTLQTNPAASSFRVEMDGANSSGKSVSISQTSPDARRWRQYDPSKCRELLKRRHGVTMKLCAFRNIAERTANPADIIFWRTLFHRVSNSVRSIVRANSQPIQLNTFTAIRPINCV
jgi:hypothetical protein